LEGFQELAVKQAEVRHVKHERACSDSFSSDFAKQKVPKTLLIFLVRFFIKKKMNRILL